MAKRKQIEEAVEESAEEPVEESAEESVEESVEEPVEAPVEAPVEETAEEPAEDSLHGSYRLLTATIAAKGHVYRLGEVVSCPSVLSEDAVHVLLPTGALEKV